MTFGVSPGVTVVEVDDTTVVPAVSTSVGAIAGVFAWGPANQPVLLSAETALASGFGIPTSLNPQTWFCAANFLAYGQALYVTRAVDANAYNAVANTTTVTSIQIQNQAAYQSASLPAGALYIAKYPGAIGNSLRVSVCESAAAYSSVVGIPVDSNNAVSFVFPVGSNTATLTVTNSSGANTANGSAANDATNITNALMIGDRIFIGNTTSGQQYVQILSVASPTIVSNGTASATITLSGRISTMANVAQTTVTRYWEFSNLIKLAPGTSTSVANSGGAGDEIHVVVVDNGGLFTGTRGQVLEVWQGLSRATDAKSPSGLTNYYASIINGSSQYLWWANDDAGAPSNTSVNMTASTNKKPVSLALTGGADSGSETAIAPAAIMNAYSQYSDPGKIGVSLLIAGASDTNALIPNYLTNNITSVRKDCVAFISPRLADVVNNVGDELTDVLAFRNLLTETSYGFMDSGYKYQYDKYNDTYRWVPLNGDVAGLCAQTDQTNAPWWAPAGFSRGNIKNIVKLAYSPGEADRDVLYPMGINAVASFPGQGIVLYGQKTLQSKPSAFDRLNVRRLFIVLEKSISIAAKSMLFEFNDAFTRAAFVNMVTPFLTQVQGGRGIYAFDVVCDTTNNTQQVIDSNQFVGDIYIQPTRVAEFIKLSFVAVNTGVSFSTVTGSSGA